MLPPAPVMSVSSCVSGVAVTSESPVRGSENPTAAPNNVLRKSLRLGDRMDLKAIVKYQISQGSGTKTFRSSLLCPFRSLLDSQCFPRINPRRASRRNEAGQCRGCDQEKGNRSISDRIEGGNPE